MVEAMGFGDDEDLSRSEQAYSRFIINPPQTSMDAGKPSVSILKDAQRIFLFIEDERHLTAHELYLDVKDRLDEREEEIRKERELEKQKQEEQALSSSRKSKRRNAYHKTSKEDEEFVATRRLLDERKKDLTSLQERARLFKRAKTSFDTTSADWNLAQTFFGIKTSYRREADGSLSILIEGKIKGVPLFEQVAVLREVDLHYRWAPFCSSSLVIAELGKLDIVGWFMIGLPNFGLARDSCFRAMGCDCIMEEGCIILVGQGIADLPKGVPEPEDTFLSTDPVLDTLDIPPIPTRLGSGRMTLRNFDCIIDIDSPTSANTRVICNINPNMAFIPQALIEFTMKKLCGILLYKLQGAAKKIVKNPVTNVHAQRMRDAAAFYRGWLMPKFEAACEHLGWEMSPVGAFQLTPTQLAEDFRLRDSHRRKVRSYDGSERPLLQSSMRSAESEPIWVRDRDDAGMDCDVSEISDLSGTTWTVWRNNPIVSYMKDIELRIQRRKTDAVVEARQIAAERLKPRDFELHQLERLKELKQAKKRARKRSKLSKGETPQLANKDTYRNTRLAIIFILFIVLFSMLHVDSIVDDFNFLERGDNVEWWITPLNGIGAIWYIASCGTVHFALCDITLILAFHSLELGQKSGQQIKSYYSSKVRLFVAMISVSLVILSILKAILTLWVRAIVYFHAKVFFSLLNSASQVMEIVRIVKSWIITILLSQSKDSPWNVMNVVMNFNEYLQENTQVDWTYVGNSTKHIYLGAQTTLSQLIDQWNSNLVSLIESFEAKIEVVSWRHDAFVTAKFLLSYTAVFLLVSVLFFHVIVTKTGKNSKLKDNIAQSDSSVASGLTSESNDSYLSQSDYVNGILSRNGPKISSIEEESEVKNFSPTSRTAHMTTLTANSTRDPSTEAKRKHRKRALFRRRRKKRNPLADETSSLEGFGYGYVH